MTNLTFLWLFLVFVLAVTVIKAQFALRKKRHPSIHVPRVSIPELGILWGIDFSIGNKKMFGNLRNYDGYGNENVTLK